MNMIKLTFVLVLVLILLASGAAAAGAQQEKITICHKPGSPAEGTLEVAEASVQAHLDHGDYTGSCKPPVLDGCTALNDKSLDAKYASALFTMLEFRGDEIITIGNTSAEACVALCYTAECSKTCVITKYPPIVTSWPITQRGVYHTVYWSSGPGGGVVAWTVSCEAPNKE